MYCPKCGPICNHINCPECGHGDIGAEGTQMWCNVCTFTWTVEVMEDDCQ